VDKPSLLVTPSWHSSNKPEYLPWSIRDNFLEYPHETTHWPAGLWWTQQQF
jgi:hypothetical protein